MSGEKPERIRWAITILAVQPKEKILEIGCGNGHAIALVCKQLTTGKVVGIDRSTKAIRTATANNQSCVNSGKAQFFNMALAEIQFNETFDKIFAVNVNVFWTGPEQEVITLPGLMKKRSRLYLFYAPPSSDQLEKVIEKSKKYLEAENFDVVEVLRKRLASHDSVCIIAKKINA